jgi:Domain of unknown function (DUF4105)
MMAAESLWEWVRQHPWQAVIGAVLLFLIAFAISIIAKTPRLDRNWVEHLARMPDIKMDEDGFSLGPATDWTYDAKGPTTKGTVDFAAKYSDLKNVWFMVEPQPGGGYAAHTLLLFEFAGDRIIGVTVEARREVGEEYDAFQGLFNKFELAYIWSTAKELLTRRAVYLAKEIFVYPLALTEKQKADFLKALLMQTQSLEAKPRFYNTIVSNCTNELGKVAQIPWHYSFVLTGYSPQYLYRLKYIPGLDFATARRQAKLDAEIRSWNNLPTPEFDRALLTELRKRMGETSASMPAEP